MARNINRVVITGNLTRDPELRTTPGGMQVLGIGVAVNDERKNSQTGEWESYTNFINCVTFGRRAEALASILHKGTKVAIEGKLRWSSWETDGQKRNKIEVIIDEIELLTPKGGANNGGGYATAQSAPAPVASGSPDITVYDEDIPF
jgi:single-strand DNA-binding protein